METMKLMTLLVDDDEALSYLWAGTFIISCQRVVSQVKSEYDFPMIDVV